MKRAPLLIGLCRASALTAGAQPDEGWRTFEGSWSATGRSDRLPTEGSRLASVLRLSGAMVLKNGDGLRRGFLGEAIGFDDGLDTRVGRAVWTDDQGDRVFSEFRGETLETGRRMIGRITGGSGRYANATGEYELTWQYVVRPDEGTFQGRAADLKGRVRLAPAAR
jgi:hypothetical protein